MPRRHQLKLQGSGADMHGFEKWLGHATNGTGQVLPKPPLAICWTVLQRCGWPQTVHLPNKKSSPKWSRGAVFQAPMKEHHRPIVNTRMGLEKECQEARRHSLNRSEIGSRRREQRDERQCSSTGKVHVIQTEDVLATSAWLSPASTTFSITAPKRTAFQITGSRSGLRLMHLA